LRKGFGVLVENIKSQTRIVRILNVEGCANLVVSAVGDEEHRCYGEIVVNRDDVECPEQWKKDRSRGESALCAALDLMSKEYGISRWEAFNMILKSGTEGELVSDPDNLIFRSCDEDVDDLIEKGPFPWNRIKSILETSETTQIVEIG
jgi:hypothetical protein